jgi:hypothetical protein
MGGAVTQVPRTAAEHTALFLQQSAERGSPISIPGAWDIRARRPAVRAIAIADQATPLRAETGFADRERFEHEREGGGASRERTGARPTILARLWRAMLVTRSPGGARRV